MRGGTAGSAPSPEDRFRPLVERAEMAAAHQAYLTEDEQREADQLVAVRFNQFAEDADWGVRFAVSGPAYPPLPSAIEIESSFRLRPNTVIPTPDDPLACAPGIRPLLSRDICSA